MTVKSTYRKIAAFMLLFCMLLTTIVQLSHSHPAKQTAALQLKKFKDQREKEHCSLPGTDARCFLCEYQLTKDADIDLCIFHLTPVNTIPLVAVAYKDCITTAFNTCYITRGPPAAIV